MMAHAPTDRMVPLQRALAAQIRDRMYWQGVSTVLGVLLTALAGMVVVALVLALTTDAGPAAGAAVAVVDGETEILCRSWQPTGKPCGDGGCLWTQDCFECEVGGTGGCAYHHTNTSCYGSGMNSCPLLLSEGASGLGFRWSAVPGSWINEAGTALDQALRHAQD